MSPCRIGILGLSRISTKIIAAARLTENVTISAVASQSYERAIAAVASIPNATATNSYSELLARSDVDAIYISIPNSLHFEWALRAIRCGKHVLIEKPAALQSAQLRELREEAMTNGLLAMEAMWYRYHSQIQYLREQIQAKLFGKISMVSSTYCFQTSNSADIRWNAALGGGAISDLFCYQADMLTYVFGIRPKHLDQVEAFATYRNDVTASVHAELQTYDGAVINLTASIERSSPNQTVIIGDRASCIAPNLRATPDLTQVELQFLGCEPNLKKFAQENAYANMLSFFARSVRSESEKANQLNDSIANLEIMERVERACLIEMAERIALFPKVKSKLARIRQRLIG